MKNTIMYLVTNTCLKTWVEKNISEERIKKLKQYGCIVKILKDSC